jgi:alpha-tubulin suppressor-like RCC1 family protein
VHNEHRTCAIRTDLSVVCNGLKFGRDDWYWPMEGYETPYTLVPVQVKGLSRVKRLGMTVRHMCALVDSGDVYCIGFGEVGQLGNGKYGKPYAEIVAVKALDLGGVEDIAAGNEFTCARTREKKVHCWGVNTNGELGLGDHTQRTKPTMLPGLDDVIGIAAGDDHACAVRTSGEVLCWGANALGQLGTGDRLEKTVPTRVVGL